MEGKDLLTASGGGGGSGGPRLPPGFRFHPTDEELVVHYLKRKAESAPLPVAIIAEVDLYKFDPWELPAKAAFGEQEWYFFSPRERKYPNGVRPNRAATSGYWKATGTDKPVLAGGGTHKVGVKKALVFYGGKPPRGVKTNWIMHEYRLTGKKAASTNTTDRRGSLRLDDWVLCRIYKKKAHKPVYPEAEREDERMPTMGIKPRQHHVRSTVAASGYAVDPSQTMEAHHLFQPIQCAVPNDALAPPPTSLYSSFSETDDGNGPISMAGLLGQLQPPQSQPMLLQLPLGLGEGLTFHQHYQIPNLNWCSNI